MSSHDYWAKAQSGSPGTNLAEMQARLYAGETTQRMMEKFDATAAAPPSASEGPEAAAKAGGWGREHEKQRQEAQGAGA